MLKSRLIAALCGVAVAASVAAAQEYAYEARAKRNPFIPLVTPDGRLMKLDTLEEKVGDLTVEGITYDAHATSFAIVNGKVVKTGDTINGFVVLKIELGKVTFIKNNQLREVPLKKEAQ